MQMYEDSPFSVAAQRSVAQIKDSTLVSVANQETFVYQPFGPVDVATKIMVSMSLQLMGDVTELHSRSKKNYPLVFTF